MAPPTVLVVEDDQETSCAVADVLEKAGYLVDTAGNGREGLDLLLQGESPPSLILLDLRMPVMDGWEFARVVRCYRRLATIPIVIVAAGQGPGLHPKVDGVLPKPFTPEALMAEVYKHVPLEHGP